MKITAIKNFNNNIQSTNNTNFGSGTLRINRTGIASGNYQNFNTQNYDNNDNNDERNKSGLPGWVRKTMIGSLMFFVLRDEPVVQDLLKSPEARQHEQEHVDFLNDVYDMHKLLEKSSATYNLNQLYDVDEPEVKKLDEHLYSLKFSLDDNDVDLTVKLDKDNKDTIKGKIKIGDGEQLRYKAIFSPDDIENFKVILNDDANQKHILGRDSEGKLYLIKDNKKIVLNDKNVKMYQQRLESSDVPDALRFFTNENPMWHKMALLILMYLIYNEYKLDKAEREAEEKSDYNRKV